MFVEYDIVLAGDNEEYEHRSGVTYAASGDLIEATNNINEFYCHSYEIISLELIPLYDEELVYELDS